MIIQFRCLLLTKTQVESVHASIVGLGLDVSQTRELASKLKQDAARLAEIREQEFKNDMRAGLNNQNLQFTTIQKNFKTVEERLDHQDTISHGHDDKLEEHGKKIDKGLNMGFSTGRAV